MVDLDVVMEGDVFYFDPETRSEPFTIIQWASLDVPMSFPLSKELNLLAKLRDIPW